MSTAPTAKDWPHKARLMVDVIRDDIESDMIRLDCQTFNGHNVATAIGNLAAQVDALARILGDLIDRGAES